MLKSTISNMYAKTTNAILEAFGLEDLKAPEQTLDVQPYQVRPPVMNNTIVVRMPEPRQGLSLVPKEFDPDNRLHQRYLVKATEREFQGGTDAIQTAMAKVGIELTDAQAFDALFNHVAVLQSEGIEL